MVEAMDFLQLIMAPVVMEVMGAQAEPAIHRLVGTVLLLVVEAAEVFTALLEMELVEMVLYQYLFILMEHRLELAVGVEVEMMIMESLAIYRLVMGAGLAQLLIMVVAAEGGNQAMESLQQTLMVETAVQEE
jgi:hypothetical protein